MPKQVGSDDEGGSPSRDCGSAETTTIELLAQARRGDLAALDEVFARAIPPLKRWARGRLPSWARSLVDTDDLVQETVIGTLKQIDVFEYRADAALQAYLRQAVMNRIRTRYDAPGASRRRTRSTPRL